MEAVAFLTELDVRELGQDRWVLLAPLVYEGTLIHRITVPAGFETDLESVPRWLPLVYAVLYGTAHHAAVVHDWLYTTGMVNRQIADGVMYEALRARGEPAWKAYTIWAGIRLGGWVVWNKHRAQGGPRGPVV